ncbi:MAG TPA: Ig-like domain-containing protein, partial [Bacillota bacterium]|nr:Ig-like domain-containing protein [Bacillota bacterium]
MVDYVKKFKKGLFAMLGLAVLIGGIIFYQVSGARAATVDVLNGSGNMNSLWTWVQILLATGTSDGATAGSPSGPPSALAQGTGRGKVVQGYFKTGFKTPQGVSLDAASLSLYFKKAITNAPTKFDISWEIRDASDTTLILSGIINSALGNVAWTNYTNNSIDTTQLAVNTNYTLRLYMDGTTANINGSAVQVNWDDVVLNVTYTPDTTPPVTTMTSPTDGSRVKGSVPLQASASDNMGVASSWVYFEYATNTSFTGKTILPATYSGGNVTKSWDTSALNGTYYVRSHVYDTSNLDTYSNYFTYIVDNTGPTVVSATATDKTHVDVKFSEDMDSTSVQTSTNYSITGNGGLSVSSAVIDGTDKSLVHLTTSTQSNGTYTVTVSNVTDLVGNTLGAPASATFDGVTGPTFTVEYYSDSALTTALPVLASKPITKAQTVYLKITANKALTGAPTFNLDAPGAGNDLTGATTTLVSGFSYKGTWVVNAGQGDGDAIITVSANSTDGGSSTNVTPTSGGTATVDCTITSPTLATVNGYDKITLNWSTADSDISTFWVYRSTSDAFTPSVSNLVYTANSGAILSVVDNVAPGTYYYVIKARDTAGNISALSNYASGISMVGPPSFSVQYYSDAALTVPLNVYLSKPITKAQTVYLKITASKAMSVGPIFKLDAPSTDNDVTDVTTVLVSGNTYKGIWNVAFSGIAYDGDAAVQVKGTSADGGVAVYGAPTSGGTVTVDTKISTFNSFTISALVNDASLNWSIPEGDIDKYLIYRSKTEGFVPDGSNLIYTEENGAATTYTNTNVPDGTYYYKIIAQDFAGNAITSTEVSIGLPADLTGPSIVKAEATSKQLI